FLASSSASACITALVWSGVSITPSESSRVSFSGWSFGAVVVVMRPVALEGPSNHTDVLATFMPGAITPSRRDPLPDKFVRAARAPGWTIRKIVFEDQRVLLRLLDKISHWNCNAGARLPGPPHEPFALDLIDVSVQQPPPPHQVVTTMFAARPSRLAAFSFQLQICEFGIAHHILGRGPGIWDRSCRSRQSHPRGQRPFASGHSSRAPAQCPASSSPYAGPTPRRVVLRSRENTERSSKRWLAVQITQHVGLQPVRQHAEQEVAGQVEVWSPPEYVTPMASKLPDVEIAQARNLAVEGLPVRRNRSNLDARHGPQADPRSDLRNPCLR